MSDGNGLITRHLKEFCSGGILGGIAGGSFLFTNGGSWSNIIGEWVARVILTSIIALCSGLASAWAKDIYENYKNYKKAKRQEYERQKRKNNRTNGRAA